MSPRVRLRFARRYKYQLRCSYDGAFGISEDTSVMKCFECERKRPIAFRWLPLSMSMVFSLRTSLHVFLSLPLTLLSLPLSHWLSLSFYASLRLSPFPPLSLPPPPYLANAFSHITYTHAYTHHLLAARRRLEPAEQHCAVVGSCRGGRCCGRSSRELRGDTDATPDERPRHEQGGRVEAASGAHLRLGTQWGKKCFQSRVSLATRWSSCL